MKTNLKLKLATTLLCAGFILNSCTSVNKNTSHSDNLSTKSEVHTSSSVDKAAVAAEFDSLCLDLYKYLISKNYLSLHYAVENPEEFGIENYSLTFEDISKEALENNMQRLEEFSSALALIEPSNLEEKDRLTYDTLKYYLDTNLNVRSLIMHYEPLTLNTGFQATIPIMLAEYPFREEKDIENYLTLLSSLDEYYQSLIDFEQKKKEQGIVMSNESLDLVISSLDKFLLSPSGNFMQESFDNKLETFTSFDEEKKNELKARHNKLLEEDFSSAYDILRNGLSSLKSETPVSAFSEEKQKYVKYLTDSSIYHSYTDIDSLYKDIESNLKKDLKEMASLLSKSETGDDIIYNYTFNTSNPEQILAFLKDAVYGSFPLLEGLDYEIEAMPSGLANVSSFAFYLMPSFEGQKNIIYISPENIDSSGILAKLAHEGIPGHMYQWNYFLRTDPKPIWNLIANPAYVEGMAVYAESLSYTFDSHISPTDSKLLKNNFTSRLALYAFLDLSVNYYGKDKEYVETYLKDNYNIDNASVVSGIYDSLVANPCNYLKYYAGYMEIINMKNEAKKELGSKYSDLDFHKFLLDAGPVPFSILKNKLKAKLMLSK